MNPPGRGPHEHHEGHHLNNPTHHTARRKTGPRYRRLLAALPLLLGFTAAALTVQPPAYGASAKAIDSRADQVLRRLDKQYPGANQVIKKAKGILVFPDVFKAGFGLGGEYGNGVLRIHGRSVAYYDIVGVSFGFQLGAQRRAVVLAFLDQGALDKFRHSNGWKVGVDGSVVLAKAGADASIDSDRMNAPIVGFVFGTEGLMYNLTLEGSKINQLHL